MADTYEELNGLLREEYAKINALVAESDARHSMGSNAQRDDWNRRSGIVYRRIAELKKRWRAVRKKELDAEKAARTANATAAGFKVGDRASFSAMHMLMGPLAMNVIQGTVVMYRGEMMVKLDHPEYASDGKLRRYAQILSGWRKVT